MNLELLAALLDGFIFYGILYGLLFAGAGLLKQHYIRKLCKHSAAKGKPGPFCVICAYHRQCGKAKQSTEYQQYAYFRRVFPHRAKEMFDKIWGEENVKAE